MTLSFGTKALSALAGASLLALSMSPASAFTLSSPSIGEPFAAAQVDKVWWRHYGYYGWHRRYWGPGWGWGGYRHCWMSPWGWRCRYW
jgi:hypothetical protein